jgi:hypothetical protein
VHASVEHDLGGFGFEEIRIRADTGVATETFEYHDKGGTAGLWADHGGGAPICQPNPLNIGIPACFASFAPGEQAGFKSCHSQMKNKALTARANKHRWQKGVILISCRP